MKIRVMLADDHAVLRAGLRMLINSQPDMEVTCEAGNGEEVSSLAGKSRADVLILDLAMPKLNGLQALPLIRRAAPRTKVLVLTMHDDTAHLRAALASGGSGYILKTSADTELLKAIRAVAGGKIYVNVSMQSAVNDGSSDASRRARGNLEALSKLLSAREREVLQLVAEGLTNQKVADRLALSVKSVETYRARLMEKLGLRSRAELVRFALDCGLLGLRQPGTLKQ